jgi:hypothetical protein
MAVKHGHSAGEFRKKYLKYGDLVAIINEENTISNHKN